MAKKVRNANVVRFITASESPQTSDNAKTKTTQSVKTKNNKRKYVQKAIKKDRNTFGRRSLVKVLAINFDIFSDF